MATYTPNEQLKDILIASYSTLNASSSQTYYNFATVPSTEYWKVRIEAVWAKPDNNESSDLNYIYRRQPSGLATLFGAENNEKIFHTLNIPANNDYWTVYVFDNSPEIFLHPGWQIGFNFTNSDAVLDVYMDITIFKYAIF